jgi:hypothetical protein
VRQVLVATFVAVALVVWQPRDPAVAAPLASQIDLPFGGPLGPITIIGDSVLQGAALISPTLPDRLVEQGWGPVRFRAGVGYSTGLFNVTTEARATYWLNRWRAEGWSTRDVVVNLGANDSGQCRTDLGCARRAILHVVDTLGPGHRVWWPMITRSPVHQASQNTWNTALLQIAGERPGTFFTWNWPLVMATGGYSSSDNTHLTGEGYRRRSLAMAEAITADLASGHRIGGDAALPPAVGGATEYVPLAPERVWDTRFDGGRPGPGGTLTVDLRPDVPPGTTAVAVNVTAADAGAAGFLTAHPCDVARPDASVVNHGAGWARAAMAVIPLSAAGTLCVYSSAGADVIVDLQGAFVAPNAASVRLSTVTPPVRVHDSRSTGRATVHRVVVPPGAEAVSVNLTATRGDAPGFLTAYPCGGAVPDVSNVNFGAMDDVAGAAFVPVSAGTICVFASAPVDVIVDVTGTFSETGALAFVPAAPGRTIDTRSGIGGWWPFHGRGQTLDARVAPPGAAAVTGTLTLVEPALTSFLTAWPCGPLPATSSVNANTGLALANSMTMAVDAGGRICVRAQHPGQTLFDTTGWWVA